MFDLILQNISHHINLTEVERNYFTSKLKVGKIKRKCILLESGSMCRVINFVVKGCLRTYIIDYNGVEHNIMLAVEEWWVTDIASFIKQTEARYCVAAIEDTEVLQITYEDMEQLYLDIPKFERFFRLLIQNSYINQQSRVIQNISFSAEERYIAFVDKYPKLIQRIPQKHLASYLGITPVFLSMIRKKLLKK